MNTIKYRALLETIRCGNLTRAAEELGYTQSSISQMIQSLEREFGFPLLIRRKEAVYPTEEARQMLPEMTRIIISEKNLLEIAEGILGVQRGHIRIGAFFSAAAFILPQVIRAFELNYPQISLEFFEGDTPEIYSKLRNNEVDLAFVTAPVQHGLKFLPLLEDRLQAIVPDTWPIAQIEQPTAAELAEYPILTTMERADEDLYRIFGPEGLTPKIKYRFKSETTLISMVNSELGIAIMSELFLRNLPEHVVMKEIDTAHNIRGIGVALPSLEAASPSTRLFIQYLTHMSHSRELAGF